MGGGEGLHTYGPATSADGWLGGCGVSGLLHISEGGGRQGEWVGGVLVFASTGHHPHASSQQAADCSLAFCLRAADVQKSAV